MRSAPRYRVAISMSVGLSLVLSGCTQGGSAERSLCDALLGERVTNQEVHDRALAVANSSDLSSDERNIALRIAEDLAAQAKGQPSTDVPDELGNTRVGVFVELYCHE